MASVVRIGEEFPAASAPVPWRQQEWAEKLPESIERGAEHLISLQSDEGYWVGELEADSTLESDYIYYLNVIGKADPVRIAKLANYVRRKQLEDGGWNLYPGGPSELNATCKAYFALKLAGDDMNAPHLTAARDTIHRLGGLEHTNSYVRFFLALDRALKIYEKLPWKPLRRRALREAKHWMLAHIERTEGLAAIYPAMMNSIFALMALGHGPDDPLTWREIKEFSRFEIEDAETIRLQPCVSPVWDTCIAMVALEEAGVAPDHPALVKSAEWILAKQILGPGDWQVKNKDAEPGGWAFEFRNDHYPDVDDTAFVLMALQRVKFPDEKRMEGAIRRGIQWLLSMQNRDGGWGAFDRDNDRRFICNIPFADHNAMIDPSTADVTARVLECLGRFGWSAEHPAVHRAVEFLLKDQSEDGSWFGRWGANYVYGTSGVLRALETVSLTARDYFQRDGLWLRTVQKDERQFGG